MLGEIVGDKWFWLHKT